MDPISQFCYLFLENHQTEYFSFETTENGYKTCRKLLFFSAEYSG